MHQTIAPQKTPALTASYSGLGFELSRLLLADGVRESTQSPLSHMPACVAGQRDGRFCSTLKTGG